MGNTSIEGAVLRKITPEAFESLFERHMMKDFPPDELRPLWAFAPLFEKNIYTCYGYYLGNELIAYGLILESKEHHCCLLDYYAVNEYFRGQGIGSFFLKELLKRLDDKKGMLIEVEMLLKDLEPHDLELRKKRILFYERLGATLKEVKGNVFGVEYQLMYLPLDTVLDNEALLKVIDAMYMDMLPEDLYTKCVQYELIK